MVTIITVGLGFIRGPTTVTVTGCMAVGWVATTTFCINNRNVDIMNNYCIKELSLPDRYLMLVHNVM